MAWLTEISEAATIEIRSALEAETRAAGGGCVEWTGEVAASKYSKYGIMRFTDGGKRKLTGAHRASYLASKGAIGPGLTVHHECYNTLCVNPGHLSLLTMSDNLRDGNPGRKPLSPKFELGDRTHCKHGHEWSVANVAWDKRGYGHCKMCVSDRFRRYLARQKALST